MIKSALGKVAWVGRTASMVFGLALVMALVFGAVSTALSATGGNFILGKANSAGAVSKLTANIANPALQLINNSTAAAATALNISVATNKPPIKVNAAAGTATGLSADELDGKDSGDFLVTGNGKVGTTSTKISACDAGPALSYPLTLTRSGRILATASINYQDTDPGPDPSISIRLLDGSNAVVAESSSVYGPAVTDYVTLTVSEVLLNVNGSAAYNAPAGDYTLQIFARNVGPCEGYALYSIPRLTHVVLAEG